MNNHEESLGPFRGLSSPLGSGDTVVNVTAGKGMKRTLLIVFLPWVVALTGCASDSATGRKAASGAALGTVGGAVAGAVGSLLWGGNPISGALKGGVTGAASGAAVGAVSGAVADSRAKKPETPPQESPALQTAEEKIAADPEFAELERKVGKDNYRAALLLAGCKHLEAMDAAGKAYSTATDSDQRAYALMVQAIAAEESGNKGLASSLYPRIVREDPKLGTAEKARAEALEGVFRVQALRQDHGLSPVCRKK